MKTLGLFNLMLVVSWILENGKLSFKNLLLDCRCVVNGGGGGAMALNLFKERLDQYIKINKGENIF